MEHSERSFMYSSSSLPRPGTSSSRIPPPTPLNKIFHEIQPPNQRIPASTNNTHHSNGTTNTTFNDNDNNNNNNNNGNNSTRLANMSNHDSAMMPPPSQALTASFKQKPPSRSPTSPRSPPTSPRHGNAISSQIPYPRTLKGNLTKHLIVSGVTGKRTTLVERGGNPPAAKISSGAQARNAVHGRSASSQIARSATIGFSKGPGSRPTSSLETRGGPPPQVKRPNSAQSERHEREGAASAASGGSESGLAIPKRKAWDLKGRLEDTENAIDMMRNMMVQERTESNNIKEQLEDHKLKAYQLETMRVTLETKNTQAQFELDVCQRKAAELERLLDGERRERRQERDDAVRRLRDETDDIRRKLRDEIEALVKSNREAMETLERKARHELDQERATRQREVQELKTQAAMEKQKLEMEMGGSAREMRGLRSELEATIGELERERAVTSNLRGNLSEQSSATLTLESSSRALRARVELLESDGQSQAQVFLDLEKRLRQALEDTAIAKEKLRAEESLRRKLHNQVQELKGNIRVFCRVRPTLGVEADGGAEMRFPDTDKEGKEIEIVGVAEKSALGNVTTKAYPFSFDKVFGPSAQNGHVFEEISQLVQSALDGYNVCIFCYGQTGSGKTYTMSSPDGMIPKAVHQIYQTASELKEKGWSYTMEGSFVEVYNENINDLLGQADDFDKKKHEIRHDAKECKTTITDINTVILDNPSRVEAILSRASKTRSVAATKANERSSRSHSVFILKLIGVNSVTGERSEGTLNLVDLAGSERLAHSGATGDRLKETQNINRSLSCLGDVIAALGNGKEGSHIPYRNSKLTYLLQYSLGGNSKCLMFVMVSPMQAHLSETLTSLKFATKVNNTSIGTAKRQKVSV